jgi:hypothetical protein
MPSSISAMNSIKAFMGFFSFSIYLLLILETTPPFTPRAAMQSTIWAGVFRKSWSRHWQELSETLSSPR